MKSENENIEGIEDLIRNDSGQETYSMQESDWEQLQMMMNADDRRKGIGWIWRGAIELILFGTWFLFINNDYQVDNGTEERTRTYQAANSQDTLMDSEKDNFQAITRVKGQAVSDKEIRNATVEKSIQESKQTLGSFNRNVSSDIAENNLKMKAKSDADSDSSLKVQSFSDSDIENGTEILDNSIDESKQVLGNVNGNSQSEIIEDNHQLESTYLVHLDSVAIDPLALESELLTENTDAEPLVIDSLDSNTSKDEIANKKLHFYLGIGTEWSAASRMPIGPTKMKFQIGAEYQFLKRWSVLSGINYTVKDYQTDAEGYSVEQGFWTSGIKPNSISAKCNVLEIPLNFRYYFTAQDTRRSSFFLSAGASSYLMATERYSFAYDSEDPTLKQEWNGKWKSMHYFSVLHFSAGYQKSLQRKGVILIEPYIDLPLTGIGFGQVDVVSFGLSLQFKY